jgi:hypothetical protein
MSTEKDEESLRIVDTDDVLTLQELHELKKLANMSMTTRSIVVVVFGIVAVTGLPWIVDFISKHVH